MKAESQRKCSICGGPNHHGCGCEAKAVRRGPDVKADAPADGQPAAEAQPLAEQIPAFSKAVLETFKHFTEEDVAKILVGELDFAKDIKTMAEGFDGLCACMYDTNNYLKLITGDLITIRKLLLKEDEVKNADPDNPKKNKN